MRCSSILTTAGLLLTLPGLASAQPALAGRYDRGDGRTLELRATDAGGLSAVHRDALGRTRSGRVEVAGGAIRIAWAGRGLADVVRQAAAEAPQGLELRAASREGRLVLEGPDGPWVRAEAGAWWRLPADDRRALLGPLGAGRLHVFDQGRFAAWSAGRYGGTPVTEEQARAEWTFEALPWGERVGLVCLAAKMRADGVWRFVKAVTWVGGTGDMWFEPTVSQGQLRRELEARGFGDWWGAGRGAPWGVRHHLRGFQLHFKGGDGVVYVHADFVNPGDPPGRRTSALAELGVAWRHWRVDKEGWHENHVPERVLRETRAAGFDVVVPR